MKMGDKTKMNVVGHVTATADVVPDDSNNYEMMTPPISPVDDLYESVSPRQTPEPKEDSQGYLIPTNPIDQEESKTATEITKNELKTGPTTAGNETERFGVVSIYEDLWAYRRSGSDNTEDQALTDNNDDAIYDEVETIIPTTLPPGAKIISVEEPASAYDEVIINDSRYIIPSRQWDSDSDAFESDFDDDAEAPNYFGENLEELYENIENRKLASPTPRTVPFNMVNDNNDRTLNSQVGLLRGCFSAPSSKTTKSPKKPFDEEAPLYVDANSLGVKEPVMPPLSLDLSAEEAARYEIVKKILATEAAYKENLSLLVEIDKQLRDRKLTEDKNLDVIFCSLENILQSHEMFGMVLASRMNEWKVEGKLGDIICASFSKSTTTMAYTEFVKNFLDAIDTFRAVCKSHNVFSQFVQVKINSLQPKATFHDLMLKPFERFPEFIILVQDCLEVTPVSHVDRVPLQLALTQLECLAELINSRRKESEMKSQLKYLDTQISQLSKPLSSSGRVFIRQDDMIHCLIDGVSVVGTKKLRLVLLSDMLLCLSPVGKKKKVVSGLLNTPKYKFKLKWNVPLSDVQFVEYGAGVNVAAGKYGTTTTYSDQGKYRQSTIEIQKHIEDLQHDLAVIGQIAGLASSLRGKHLLLDQQKVERWYKSVENTITEELKTVNMFWLELSLPTRSGQHNYVFNLSSTTVKEEWQADAVNAKLALESRNNPGWYLPEDDLTSGLSILRRNMPLLAEYFDLFIFNTKSRVEHTITYPVDASNISTSMATRGLGHYVWVSARGEMQGHVSVVRFDRDAQMPRFAESFSVCPGTVYAIAHIPAMNSRPDQSAEKYHTKYGFPFPTVWLGSQSSKVYIYDASSSEDRSRPLMELKLRDAPLAMKYAMRKVYVGLANGTLAIFRSNSSGHWNLVQPSILPLGRYPVAVIADVKDKLWCSSGSQIYVVSKKGDRIQRIIAVDSNMKNLVKQVVTCGVGVWVSVWRKATIKLYHAETYEMMQEVNVVSPVTKMKNDVDSQVQYLSLDKISVTALLFIPGFLWVGTSVGLILLYPLPKMQGVPRVIGRACVAFHAHCGPVRTLFAIPQGVIAEETTSDSLSTAGEDPDEVDRKFSMLADSEESVESDEEFYFVDDHKNPSPKKNKLASSSVKPFSQRMKVTVKGSKEADFDSELTELSSNANSEEFSITQPGDFARLMTTFGGFSQDNSTKLKESDRKRVRSYKNKLFEATHTRESQEGRHPDLPKSDGSNTPDTNALSGIVDNETKPDVPPTRYDESDGNKDDTFASSMPPVDSGASDSNDVTNEKSHTGKSVDCDENTSNVENTMTTDTSTVSSSENANDMDTINELEKHKQNTDENIPVEEKNDLAGNTSETSENISQKVSSTNTQTDLKPSSLQKSENEETVSSLRNTTDVNTPPEAEQEPKWSNEPTGSKVLPNSSTSSKPLGKSQETYVTVLPDTQKRLDENSTKSSNVSTMEMDSENDSDSMFNKTGKSRARCLSYLVVSGGEGHVDLRLKVKSKQDLKKDAKSMFLIWRVNSKI